VRNGGCLTATARCMSAAPAPAPSVVALQTGSPAVAPSAAAAFHWTPAKVVLSLVLFLVAGGAEIGGGWLVWQAVREGRPWWFAFPLGAAVLVAYGFIPTAQPTADFGRVYAIYGGFFIILSYLWGWAVDGVRPDLGARAQLPVLRQNRRMVALQVGPP